jgi:hypothetical protein
MPPLKPRPRSSDAPRLAAADLLPERLLTCKEVAVLFGVSVHAIYDWSAGGVSIRVATSRRRRVRLQATPIPSGLRFAKADVEAFLERCRQLREEAVGKGEGPVGGQRPALRLVGGRKAGGGGWKVTSAPGIRRCREDEKGTYPPLSEDLGDFGGDVSEAACGAGDGGEVDAGRGGEVRADGPSEGATGQARRRSGQGSRAG